MRSEIVNALVLETEVTVKRPVLYPTRDISIFFRGVYYSQGMMEVLTLLGIKFHSIGGTVIIDEATHEEVCYSFGPANCHGHVTLGGTEGNLRLGTDGTLTIITASDELPKTILQIVRRWSDEAELVTG